MTHRRETPSDMEAWEAKVARHRPHTNLQALMETAPDEAVSASIASAAPIREAVRRVIAAMNDEDAFAVEALWYEGITVREFGERIGVSKTQAQRIKTRLAARISVMFLKENLIHERINMTNPNETPTTWNQAAALGLAVIEAVATSAAIIPEFDQSMGRMARYVTDGYLAVDINTVDESISDIASRAYMELPEPDRADMLDLIVARQRKYGTGNILSFGTIGIIVRMSDKIERLRNMGGDFADDSVTDAYMDLVGYACIHWMCANGLFEKPLHPAS